MKRGFFQIFFVLSLFFTFTLSVVVLPETVDAQSQPKRTEVSRQTISSTSERDTYMIRYSDGYILVVNDEKGLLNPNDNNAQLYPPGTTFTGQGENWASNRPVQNYNNNNTASFEGMAQSWTDPVTQTGNPGDPNRYGMATDQLSVQYWTQRIMDFILNTWLKVISGVLGIAGYVFDEIVKFTLNNNTFESGGNPQDVKLGPTVDSLWAFIRDLANIVIVFSMLYLAIRTILDGEGFADKSKLANVLLAAILINFSLFATKAAFTVSNSVATEIKNKIQINEGGTIAAGATSTASTSADSLSAGIARTLGVPKSIQNISDQSLNNSGNLNDYQAIQFQYLLMLTLSVIGVGFILVAGALMLLYRFIMFIFLIILAPIGLVCFFIPWLKKYGQEWVDKVKALTLLAPVYFLSFYVSMLLLSKIVALGNVTTQGFLGIMVQMAVQTLLIVGTLFGTIMLPIKVTSAGGEFIGNMGKWTEGKFRSMGNSVRAMPGRAARGSAQLAGRGAATGLATGSRWAIGKGGSRLVGGSEETRKRLQMEARSDDFWVSKKAKARLALSEGLKNRTYDFRNVGGIGKKWGIGEGIKNYGDAVEERKKKLKDKQEKDSKRYGFDKLKSTEVELATARNARDEESEKFKEHEAELKSAIRSGTYSEEDLKEKADLVEAARKKLEEKEEELGRKMNKGMDDQLEKLKKKWAHKMTPVRRDALKKMEDEFKKKYKEDGKVKKKKKGSGDGSGGTP